MDAEDLLGWTYDVNVRGAMCKMRFAMQDHMPRVPSEGLCPLCKIEAFVQRDLTSHLSRQTVNVLQSEPIHNF